MEQGHYTEAKKGLQIGRVLKSTDGDQYIGRVFKTFCRLDMDDPIHLFAYVLFIFVML